ncbi:MAG TPA: inorganic phosphate transporter, partial [Flavobacteriales bacterium]
TISKSVHAEFITLPVILSGLVAAIIWNLLTWWYGIPSSSSHTLIGGFAGAAIAHAFAVSDGPVPLRDIVQQDKIIQIVMFIFLAPLLGMFISMFIMFITIMRKTWSRVAVIVAVAVGAWFLFAQLQYQKQEAWVEKYYGLNDLAKKAADSPEAQTEYEQASAKVEAAQAFLPEFGAIGGKGIAAKVQAQVDPELDVDRFSEPLDTASNLMIRIGIMAIVLLFIAVYVYVEKVRTPNAFSMSNMFKRLQLVSSAAFSIGHGGNDAQKVMGIIAAALVANGNIQEFKDMPNWVPFACYAAIGLGTLSGGWKIVKTMGSRITKVTPLEGVCAESAGAMTLYLTEQMGIPVSTTHTITGSIIGVGATKRLSAVRWGVTVRLLWAWIITIPVSALMAAITYFLYQLILG